MTNDSTFLASDRDGSKATPRAPRFGRRRSTRTRHEDRGVTIVELLITMVISGTMIASVALAYSVFVRTYPDTLNRVAVSKDVTFIQAWLPVDLASALEIKTEWNHQPATVALEGVNVMSIVREDLGKPGSPKYVVNYRYQAVGSDWVLMRYEIRNPLNVGGPEEVRLVGVAHELVHPAAGWTQNSAPIWAIDVTGRNPGELRKVGTDATVFFTSGDSFNTGGAGLGPGTVLAPVGDDGFVNPKSPPSRCGGRLTLVLDSSGSIGSNMTKVETAAKDIVRDFRGTPTQLRIVEFDDTAKALAPTTWNGAFVDMLNLTDAQRNDINTKIDAMVAGGVTNWEDALRMAMTDYSNKVGIAPSVNVPDTVIFMTDGSPTAAINASGNAYDEGGSYKQVYLEEAKSISNMKGVWGVKMKGVFITTSTGSAATTELNRLKEVVGTTEWAAPTGGVGNADAAAVFTGNFDKLSDIFKQIFVSECGGTVTVQHRINGNVAPSNEPTSGTYHYSTSTGDGELRIANGQSLTFDYEFDAVGSQWVPMTEEFDAAHPIIDVQCSVNGAPIPSSRIAPLIDQNNVNVPNGRLININANEAMSCLFIEA